MSFADIGNAFFEAFGGVLLWLNCWRLYKDKQFRGVSIIPTAFFFFWGVWNLYFYPAVGAWLSFCGGLVIVSANCVWLVQMIYYSRRNREAGKTKV